MRRAVVVAAALLAAPLAIAGAASDRELIGQLDREVIAMRQKLTILEERLRGCAATTSEPGGIYPELVQVFSGGPVKVERRGGTTQVVLPGDVLFSQGGVTIREEASFALDLLATALKLHMEVTVLLVGHTDTDPPSGPLRKLYASNWELSYARALAVARSLTEEHGVPYTRFTVAGRADLDPIAGSDTPEGRLQNQRVVAILTPGVSQ